MVKLVLIKVYNFFHLQTPVKTLNPIIYITIRMKNIDGNPSHLPAKKIIKYSTAYAKISLIGAINEEIN